MSNAITALANSHPPITKWYSTDPMSLLITRVGRRKEALSFQEIPAIHSKVESAEIQMDLSRSATMDNRSSGINNVANLPLGRFPQSGSVGKHTCIRPSVSKNAFHTVGSGQRMYTPCSPEHDKSAPSGPFTSLRISLVG